MNPLQPQPPSVTLTGQTNELNGQVFSGTGTNLLIGRQPDCQLQINHSQVSRQHARLIAAPGQWLVQDLGSANGTFVNGQRVSDKHPLRPGDRLSLGSYEFSFGIGALEDKTLLAPPIDQVPLQPPLAQPQPTSPPYVQAQAAQAKRHTCLSPCLIVVLVLSMLTILPAAALGIYFYDEIVAAVAELRGTNVASGNDVSGRDAVSVSSQHGGLVTTTNGASLLIPPGAVPPQENGAAGEMTFSLLADPNRSVSLPDTYQAIGPVYQLGPEGFTFNTPVMLNLPIPTEVDPSTVLGLTYFDAASDEWQMIPAAIDSEHRIASVSTTHFSPWSLFGNSERSSWRNSNGGSIQVSNQHQYNSGIYPPGGGRKPYTVTYGVCIQSYNLDQPEQRWAWSPPEQWAMTVSDYVHPLSDSYWRTRQFNWWLPNGNYELIEVWHFSEVNYAPLYTPQYASYWRPLGSVHISANSRQAYSYSEGGLNLTSYTAGRPPCFGLEDTSVGTGDVQVTLSWNTSVDLDLHVIDPTGTEIYYGNPASANGGQLDRDNSCSNMTVGRPENIFWPDGGAPSGSYTIYVDYYGECADAGAVSYTVRTVVQGSVKTFSGTISPSNSPQEVATIEVR